MVAKVGEPQEDIEARMGALRQYAAVMSDFYEALSEAKPQMPPDLVGDIVMAWWQSVLTPVDEEYDDDL